MASQVIDSPFGKLFLLTTDKGLKELSWSEKRSAFREEGDAPPESCRHLTQAVEQLQEYFAGKRATFELTLDLRGTPFQMRAWRALLQIPFGTTWSYQAQAFQAGNGKAVRAIGLANSKNPIGIVVPCHRVIGKNGRLTGFAAGLETKRKLLEHEQHVLETNPDQNIERRSSNIQGASRSGNRLGNQIAAY